MIPGDIFAVWEQSGSRVPSNRVCGGSGQSVVKVRIEHVSEFYRKTDVLKSPTFVTQLLLLDGIVGLLTQTINSYFFFLSSPDLRFRRAFGSSQAPHDRF